MVGGGGRGLAAEHLAAVDVFELQGGLLDHRCGGECCVVLLNISGDGADAFFRWIRRCALEAGLNSRHLIEVEGWAGGSGAAGEAEGDDGLIVVLGVRAINQQRKGRRVAEDGVIEISAGVGAEGLVGEGDGFGAI